MLSKFIATLMLVGLTNTALAKTEVQCYAQLAKDTNTKQESITVILMQCNNLFLDGQGLWLNSSKATDKIIRKRFPAASEEYATVVSAWERAEMLMTYTDCENVARNLKLYMTKCIKGELK